MESGKVSFMRTMKLPPTCAAGAVSGLAASGGNAWEERDRGGGLGEARTCEGPAEAVGAAACCG